MFDQAKRVFDEARERYAAARSAGALWDAPATYRSLTALVPSGIYEHFKSAEMAPKRYAVLGISFDVETMAPEIVYVPLYGAHHGVLMRRSLLDEADGFLAPVERPEYQGPRFRLVREAALGELAVELEG
ncbi:MAG: DUF1653 domain-containing protein [Patescibacteria group bacterium]|nr:DUF1653 domain-containing protein [Patescibacteria group bacterium]MDE1944452.1 DUF1653 domain-containing protein [Patescibacteria group bacterium]MDE1945132.1 DUF1653 domain-containing protein [Patescibacteria group bacterium]MDE2057667.1 DUF1653 domain-containing protein [Patescibacteria group bacterium]